MKPIHWRRSRIGKYLRHLPRAKHVRGTFVHRFFGDRLFESELWHPTRTRFAAGMAVGAFFSMMPPLPFQMLGAAVLAYITRVYIPAAIAATWISNPFTTPFCVYAQYRLGCLIMGREPVNFQSDHLISSLAAAPLPYLVGILPSATLFAMACYPITLFLWDKIMPRIEASRKRRASAAARAALHDALPATLREEPQEHTGADTR